MYLIVALKYSSPPYPKKKPKKNYTPFLLAAVFSGCYNIYMILLWKLIFTITCIVSNFNFLIINRRVQMFKRLEIIISFAIISLAN